MKVEAKYRCYTKAICNIGVTTILAKFYKIIRKVIGLLGTYFENHYINKNKNTHDDGWMEKRDV